MADIHDQVNAALTAKKLDGTLGVKSFDNDVVEVYQNQFMVSRNREIPIRQMTKKEAIDLALLLIKAAQS